MNSEGFVHCPHCGQYHPESVLYCPTTGLPIYREVPPAAPRSSSRLKVLIGTGAVLFLILGAAAVIALVSLLRQNFSAPHPADDLSTLFPPTGLATLTATSLNGSPEATLTTFPTDTPDGGVILFPTETPHPTITATAQPWEACSGADYLSRVHVGDTVKVSENPPLANRVRSKADLNGSVLGYIQPGEEALVLDGPGCSNNWVWWRVQAKDTNLTGWTAEGDQSGYWLVPATP